MSVRVVSALSAVAIADDREERQIDKLDFLGPPTNSILPRMQAKDEGFLLAVGGNLLVWLATWRSHNRFPGTHCLGVFGPEYN